MDGMEIAYTRSGTGVPLVLLHAFPLSSLMWAAQRGGLSRSADVLTPDQRGFGESAGPDVLDGVPADLNQVVDDLVRLLDQLELREVVLGGLSMGGYVALAFARRYPDRLRGLLLANTKASADPADAVANRLRIAEAVERAGSSEPLLTEVFPKLLAPDADPGLAQTVREQLLQAPPAAVAWAQRAMAARSETRDVLVRLRVPVLVVCGEADALMARTESEAMANAAWDAELVEIPGAGHLSALEAPREFNAAVDGLLKRV
ncbi:MAG: alpha/beta fold hydrolase [Micromonosporaceae bacterium]